MYNRINSSYEHALALVYHKISKRGIHVDQTKLELFRQELINEIINLCTTLTTNWGIYVHCGPYKPTIITSLGRSVNINSSSGANSLLNTLKNLGYDIPKVRKKDSSTGEYEFKEAADQLTLMKMFASTGDENLKHVLRIRELTKILSTYVNARLFRNTYFSAYNVAATITGRRGSKKHIWGYGGNGQNFPKHSELGEKFLNCLTAREGKIFLFVDQMSAEEWPQAALAQNHNTIKELSSTTWPENDRHSKLACFVFTSLGIPVKITDYTKAEWKNPATKAGIMRYIGGKKPRHANAYGLQGARLSEMLAGEGFAFTPKQCTEMIEAVNVFDPSIRGVYHVYIRNEITNKRLLVTPLGRERQFFGLRPNSPNYDIFNEGYAYIPQSIVGDNTGLSVLWLDDNNSNFVIQESHDSLAQELDDNYQALEDSLLATKKAFDRPIRFHNGFEINIPIEGEIGYSFGETVKLKNMDVESLQEAYKQLKQQTQIEVQEHSLNAAHTC